MYTSAHVFLTRLNALRKEKRREENGGACFARFLFASIFHLLFRLYLISSSFMNLMHTAMALSRKMLSVAEHLCMYKENQKKKKRKIANGLTQASRRLWPPGVLAGKLHSAPWTWSLSSLACASCGRITHEKQRNAKEMKATHKPNDEVAQAAEFAMIRVVNYMIRKTNQPQPASK